MVRHAIVVDNNKIILDLAKSNKDYSGMGTTFVAATIVENHVYIANVGDSFCLLTESVFR